MPATLVEGPGTYTALTHVHMRTLTFYSKFDTVWKQNLILPPRLARMAATGSTALAATVRSVVVAKVTTRPAEVAGRLSSCGGAHLGRSGRVGGCAGNGTHARRAKVMVGRGTGRGEGF